MIFPCLPLTETIGTMTDARYQLAQHFYLIRPLVIRTRMLLKVQTGASHW